MKLVLIGDGDSPHLFKWARALRADARVGHGLHAVSSRGFPPGFDELVPAQRRLALHTQPRHAGGNARVLLTLPRLVRWLRQVQPDCLHAHYLSSHGTLAWLALRLGGVRGEDGHRARLVASAWGSDVLVTPQRSALARMLLRRVLAASHLTTSDSRHMAEVMRGLGARDPMVFPFGLDTLPPPVEPADKDAHLWFSNRALEPIYNPLRVAQVFAQVLAIDPQARLVVAHEGSERDAMAAMLGQLGCIDRVQFTGRLDAASQAVWYRRATWYLSLPRSDSVSVSVLEAMAHGCIPVVSDLPANRELVRDGDNGIVLQDDAFPTADRLDPLRRHHARLAAANRDWVARHALFAPCVQRFVDQLQAIGPLR